ncbi:MAG: hypothetical protein NZM25_02105 [Leptospiraceae bacterium]|nr:hypothetical protein [Leptospiraceae bacterium]MDW8306970.1 hypothetical protein [Leptospiraceae bacterium]
MEETLKKLVNLGIGAVESIQEAAREALNRLEKEANNLIAKGETIDNETTRQIREFATDAAKRISEVASNSSKTIKEIADQAQKLINDTIAQAKTRIDDLTGKKENTGA